MRRANSLKWTLMLGEIEGRGRRGQQRMRWLDSITDSMDINLSELWVIVEDGETGVLRSMESQRVGHDLATENKGSLPDPPWGPKLLRGRSLCLSYSPGR